MSLSDDDWSLRKFGNDAEQIRDFLKINSLGGLELYRCFDWQVKTVPKEKIIGRHMPFWPAWLDFWRGNREELMRQFGSIENAKGYYNAETPEEFAANRRRELNDIADMGIQYAVFHVSHTQFEHCYTGRYTYTDEEIIDTYIDMMNEALRDAKPDHALLFENHWFPGLTFLDGKLAMRLLEKIDHPDTGFVLDISHLTNTNPKIKTEEEAVDYILYVLDRMGEAARYIRTIHLNSSAGAMDRVLEQKEEHRQDGSYEDMLIRVMKYVCGMDPHRPVTSAGIRRVIDRVQPEYLVYELASTTLEELQEAVAVQNKSVCSEN
jgi:Sugar phosphate isomerases/epimerases